MNLNNVNNVFFIGVGGIGMSAIARYFNGKGKVVAGYDKTETVLTKALFSEGISVIYEDEIEVLPEWISTFNQNAIVVYTPAIPSDNVQFNYLKGLGYKMHKRSEILGELTNTTTTVGVAGTHGKTTTSSLIAHILTHSGFGCNAFLGGIATNYNSNVLLNVGSDNTVVEADEYDRSFLTLFPTYAVVTSMDADHLDVYGEKEQLEESFRLYVNQIKPNGTLVRKAELSLEGGVTYSITEKADYQGKNIRVVEGNYLVDIDCNKCVSTGVKVGLPGRHNVENAIAAFAICAEMGVEISKIEAGISSFKGVKRRFEYQINEKDVVFIDDYAHHPEELNAAIGSAKELYPTKKITGVFQPHLYSRTRDFADGFSESLSLLDEVLLLDIYPARELPIEGVTSEMLLQKITSPFKQVVQRSELIATLRDRKIEVLMTLGAGDIDQLVQPIKTELQR